MPTLRPGFLLAGLGLCLALGLSLWIAAWVFLVSQEDYTPAPGSLTYYLGISPLVRQAPLAQATGSPEYYGTVGDGNKLPQSLVSYAVEQRDVRAALQAMDGYLRQVGWQPRPVDTSGAAATLAAHGETIHYAEYASADGEVAVLQATRSGSPGRHAITLTHYH